MLCQYMGKSEIISRSWASVKLSGVSSDQILSIHIRELTAMVLKRENTYHRLLWGELPCTRLDAVDGSLAQDPSIDGM